MRNLKRALSLGLASSMVLGTMAFSASAATSTSVTPTEVTTTFSDNDTIAPENVNSVFIAEQIGLVSGIGDGIFDPESTVTRIQMAVICVNLKFGVDFAYANFEDYAGVESVFADVPDWAKAYAKVAAQEGIIYGVGSNENGEMMFNPDGEVIAADALLMIMKTLGYFQNPTQEFAVDYKYATGARATELGLYDEKEYTLVDELSREEVYAVAIRALTTCARVLYNYETGNYYNESAGYNSALLPNNNIVEDTLGYQKFNLKAVDSVDSFNRPTTLWTVSSKEVANFVQDEHKDSDGNAMVFTTAKTYQEIAKELSTVTKESNEEYYDYGVYIDGMEYGEWMLANGYDPETEIIDTTTTLEGFNSVISTKNTGHFVPSNNGVLTQVFVTEPVSYFDTQGNWIIQKGKVHVTCINTFLAEVRSSYDYGNGEYGTTVRYYEKELVDSNEDPEGLDVPDYVDVDVITTEEFAKGDVVMIQISAKNATAATPNGWSEDDIEIVHINAPETVTGDVTSVKLSADYVGGMWVHIDEEEYDFSVGMRGNLSDLSKEMAPSAGDEIIAYFDANVQENDQGYMLGYTVVEKAPQYLYVEECDGDGFSFYDGSTARVTLADGEESIIQIVQIDGETVGWDNYSKIPEGSRFKNSDNQIISANENFVVETKASGEQIVDTTQIENRVFGYEVVDAEKGWYNIITTIQDSYSADDGASQGGHLLMSNDAFNSEGKKISTGTHGTLEFSLKDENDDPLGSLDSFVADSDPVKDTMAIFSSVYLPYNGSYGDAVDYEDDVVAVPENSIGTSNEYYNFALYAGEPASYVMQSTPTGDLSFDPLVDSSYPTIDGKTLDASAMETATKHDHLFRMDTNTVFVDVVNNKVWQGIYDSELEDIDNGLLNMQVIFGEGGYADTVFINYGITDEIGTGDFIIFQDSKPVETKVDGTTYYTYKVWENGELKELTTKSKQVVVTNEEGFWKDNEEGNPLQTNTLYRITEYNETDDYLIAVEYEYDYSPLFTARYNDEARILDFGIVEGNGTNTKPFDDVYNNLWSVATHVNSSSLTLKYDDSYVYTGSKNETADFGDGLMDGEEYTGADIFQIGDDTIFMVIDVDTTGKLKNVYQGDYTDIINYRDDDDHYVSWVDVVSVKKTTSSVHTPYAELVVVINPYTRGAVAESENGYVGDCANILSYDRDAIAEGGLTSGTIENPIRIENVVHKEYTNTLVYTHNEQLKYDVIAQILCDYFDEEAGDTWEVYYENNLEIKWWVTNEYGTQYYSFHIEDAVSEEEENEKIDGDWTKTEFEIDSTYVGSIDGVDEVYLDLSNNSSVKLYNTGDTALKIEEALTAIREALILDNPGSTVDALWVGPDNSGNYTLDVTGVSVTTYTFDASDLSTMKDAIVVGVYDNAQAPHTGVATMVDASGSASLKENYLFANSGASNRYGYVITETDSFVIGAGDVLRSADTTTGLDVTGIYDASKITPETGMKIYSNVFVIDADDLEVSVPNTLKSSMSIVAELDNVIDWQSEKADNLYYTFYDETPEVTWTVSISKDEKVAGYGTSVTFADEQVKLVSAPLFENDEDGKDGSLLESVFTQDSIDGKGYLLSDDYTIVGELTETAGANRFVIKAPVLNVGVTEYFTLDGKKIALGTADVGTYLASSGSDCDNTTDVLYISRTNGDEFVVRRTEANTNLGLIKAGDIIETDYVSLQILNTGATNFTIDTESSDVELLPVKYLAGAGAKGEMYAFKIPGSETAEVAFDVYIEATVTASHSITASITQSDSGNDLFVSPSWTDNSTGFTWSANSRLVLSGSSEGTAVSDTFSFTLKGIGAIEGGSDAIELTFADGQM